MLHRQGSKGTGKRGRPAKSLAEQRRHRHSVSFTDAEQEQFDHRRGEYRPTDYIRLVSLSSQPPPRLVPKALLQEFCRLYATLDQIDIWIEVLEFRVEWALEEIPVLIERVTELLSEVRALRSALLESGS